MPKFNAIEDVDLYDRVKIPTEYFPQNIGPGAFSPRTMYIHALAVNKSIHNEYATKNWVILWLLDHIDWNKIEGIMYKDAT